MARGSQNFVKMVSWGSGGGLGWAGAFTLGGTIQRTAKWAAK